jgi:ergothioneine biosynthesis protein EgtB
MTAPTATTEVVSDRSRESLLASYHRIRDFTETLAQPLSAEDQQAQSMPDVSPTKWHRAHTTWFFETFVLAEAALGYRAFDDAYAFLFNSYYEAVGARHARPERGLITRPTCDEIAQYRAAVDAAMRDFIAHADDDALRRFDARIELGLHHEQQHQELLLMDIKHVFSRNGFDPAYRRAALPRRAHAGALAWRAFDGGLADIGHAPPTRAAFAFDNEGPQHTALLEPFALAQRLVTAGEWLAFIADDGYRRPELWLSDGWATVQREGWDAPLYWEPTGDDWTVLTLDGRRAVLPEEPVVHVSHYEADAFARWSGARLPTELEWEHAAVTSGADPTDANVLGDDPLTAPLHPRCPTDTTGTALSQLFGDVWEWTSSAYLPYPRFAPAAGAIGEYNGKFMSNQMVLRGGACVTPPRHVRATYRNFFYPHQRWMFAGVRLARDV